MEVINALAECLGSNMPVALVTVIENLGSFPGKTGAMMIVRGDKQTFGTIGGGNLELQAIDEALISLGTGENREVTYSLDVKGQLAMTCGGSIRFFIRVFHPKPQLLIVGGGHVGLELYHLALHQGFRVVVMDDRPEFASHDRFPEADIALARDIPSALAEYPVTKDCYIAIATRSHALDRQALEAVVTSEAAYVGMIGSSNKVRTTFRYLLAQGVPREKIDAVYAPMGLNIASVRPKEIALSILSEILLVKNGGTAEHVRSVKNIRF